MGVDSQPLDDFEMFGLESQPCVPEESEPVANGTRSVDPTTLDTLPMEDFAAPSSSHNSAGPSDAHLSPLDLRIAELMYLGCAWYGPMSLTKNENVVAPACTPCEPTQYYLENICYCSSSCVLLSLVTQIPFLPGERLMLRKPDLCRRREQIKHLFFELCICRENLQCCCVLGKSKMLGNTHTHTYLLIHCNMLQNILPDWQAAPPVLEPIVIDEDHFTLNNMQYLYLNIYWISMVHVYNRSWVVAFTANGTCGMHSRLKGLCFW